MGIFDYFTQKPDLPEYGEILAKPSEKDQFVDSTYNVYIPETGETKPAGSTTYTQTREPVTYSDGAYQNVGTGGSGGDTFTSSQYPGMTFNNLAELEAHRITLRTAENEAQRIATEQAKIAELQNELLSSNAIQVSSARRELEDIARASADLPPLLRYKSYRTGEYFATSKEVSLANVKWAEEQAEIKRIAQAKLDTANAQKLIEEQRLRDVETEKARILALEKEIASRDNSSVDVRTFTNSVSGDTITHTTTIDNKTKERIFTIENTTTGKIETRTYEAQDGISGIQQSGGLTTTPIITEPVKVLGIPIQQLGEPVLKPGETWIKQLGEPVLKPGETFDVSKATPITGMQFLETKPVFKATKDFLTSPTNIPLVVGIGGSIPVDTFTDPMKASDKPAVQFLGGVLEETVGTPGKIVETAIPFAVGGGIGVGAKVVSAGAKTIGLGGVASVTGKVVGTGLGVAFVGQTGAELYKSETPVEKGEIVGSFLKESVGFGLGFKAGSGLGTSLLPKVEVVEKVPTIKFLGAEQKIGETGMVETKLLSKSSTGERALSVTLDKPIGRTDEGLIISSAFTKGTTFKTGLEFPSLKKVVKPLEPFESVVVSGSKKGVFGFEEPTGIPGVVSKGEIPYTLTFAGGRGKTGKGPLENTFSLGVSVEKPGFVEAKGVSSRGDLFNIFEGAIIKAKPGAKKPSKTFDIMSGGDRVSLSGAVISESALAKAQAGVVSAFKPKIVKPSVKISPFGLGGVSVGPLLTKVATAKAGTSVISPPVTKGVNTLGLQRMVGGSGLKFDTTSTMFNSPAKSLFFEETITTRLPPASKEIGTRQPIQYVKQPLDYGSKFKQDLLVDSKIKIDTKIRQDLLFDSKIKQDIQTKQYQFFDITQKQDQQTKQITQQVSKLKQIPATRLANPFKFTPRPPRERLRGIPLLSMARRRSSRTARRRTPSRAKKLSPFSIEVRRRGKYSKIGEAKSIGEALRVGAKRTSQTLAATFRIKRGGEVLDIKPVGKRYRKAKREKGAIVQRRKYRLSSGSEKREINFFRRTKAKPKNNPFRIKK